MDNIGSVICAGARAMEIVLTRRGPQTPLRLTLKAKQPDSQQLGSVGCVEALLGPSSNYIKTTVDAFGRVGAPAHGTFVVTTSQQRGHAQTPLTMVCQRSDNVLPLVDAMIRLGMDVHRRDNDKKARRRSLFANVSLHVPAKAAP